MSCVVSCVMYEWMCDVSCHVLCHVSCGRASERSMPLHSSNSKSAMVRGGGYMVGGEEKDVLRPVSRHGEGRGPRLLLKSGGVVQDDLFAPLLGPPGVT